MFYIKILANGIWGLILFGLALFFTGTKLSDFVCKNSVNARNFIINGFFIGIIFQVLISIPGLMYGSEAIILNSKELKNTILLFIFYCFCFISLAIFEEFLFRGYILKKFINKFSPFIAIILESIIFSALHLFQPTYKPTDFISAFSIGILLSILSIKDISLVRCISLHASYNIFEELLHDETNVALHLKIINTTNFFVREDYVMIALLSITIIICVIKYNKIIAK